MEGQQDLGSGSQSPMGIRQNRNESESPNQSDHSCNNQEQLSNFTFKKQTKLTWTLIPEPSATQLSSSNPAQTGG